MNVGLGNLDMLKRFLLAPALQIAPDYDAKLVLIGRGVAAQIEQYCSRKFQRIVADTYVTSADKMRIVLERYPIETISKIEIRDDMATGWVDQGAVTNVVFNMREESGILEFAGSLGAALSRIRITYTGGYFFETAEPTDSGYPTAQPTGSEALTDELRFAWLMQCQHVWSQMDKLGVAIAEKPSSDSPMLKLQWLPEVEDIIRDYRRFAT